MSTISISFNPCFSGSCSRIILWLKWPRKSLVSILVLVDLAHELRESEVQESLLGVSILVLVDLAHESYRFPVLSCNSHWGFNPCFSGSCSRIIYTPRGNPRGSPVSILVLVDLAHELFTVHISPAFFVRFNPCFSGSCSRIKLDLEPYTVDDWSFNPCFSGSCSRINSLNSFNTSSRFQSLF